MSLGHGVLPVGGAEPLAFDVEKLWPGATNAEWEVFAPRPRSHFWMVFIRLLKVRLSHRPKPSWDPPVEGDGGGVLTGFREEDFDSLDEDPVAKRKPMAEANPVQRLRLVSRSGRGRFDRPRCAA